MSPWAVRRRRDSLAAAAGVVAEGREVCGRVDKGPGHRCLTERRGLAASTSHKAKG